MYEFSGYLGCNKTAVGDRRYCNAAAPALRGNIKKLRVEQGFAFALNLYVGGLGEILQHSIDDIQINVLLTDGSTKAIVA